jgi:hypothetical protein
MSQTRSIGEILMSVGRVSEEDIATALEYQRQNGGYFGQALVACGIVSEETLDWSLASQFDLPYVFPEAESVDPEAAALVSPEWALSNLALPILKTSTSLKVVIDSPTKDEALATLAALTGLEIEPALAASSAIRDVIRQVYARGTAAEEGEERLPIELADALDDIMEASSARFGISIRGARSIVWWEERGDIRRRGLTGDWRLSLDRMLAPGLSPSIEGKTRASWEAELHRSGMGFGVQIDHIADESGSETLFRPKTTVVPLRRRFTPPADGVVAEIRLLARSGRARLIVTTSPESLGHEILPHLPSLLLPRSWRSIYVNASDQDAAGESFSLRLPENSEAWAEEITALQSFQFDVVTADLSGGDHAWADSVLDIASVAFLLWQDDDLEPALEAGIRWQLRIDATSEGDLEWSLESLHNHLGPS